MVQINQTASCHEVEGQQGSVGCWKVSDNPTIFVLAPSVIANKWVNLEA